MNGPITTEETYHVSNILKHYAHAREKHPYFCAQHIQPGKYHCFDIPRVIICGDIDTCYKVAAILKKYTIGGRWQVSVYSS